MHDPRAATDEQIPSEFLERPHIHCGNALDDGQDDVTIQTGLQLPHARTTQRHRLSRA
jgi:hypothetical protein